MPTASVSNASRAAPIHDGTVTFTASNWNSAQNGGPGRDANDDTAVIGLSVAGGDYASFAAGSVSIDVDDDETDSSGITLTVSPAEVAESANATDITVTATLNGGTRDAATPVTVAVGSGTATSGADFAIVSNFTITIPASTQSQTGTFSLDPTQDTIDEPEETVAVDGSTTVSGVSVTDTMVKITDDDVAPTVTLSLSRDTIRETDNSSTANVEEHKTTITASLNHASSAQTTVTVSVDPNSPARSSDYSLSTNKVLTFAAGSTSSTGAVTITAVNNEIDATDKTVSVEGTASNSQGISDPADVALTLEDDDTRGVTLSETDLDINEGGNGTYTVVLDTRPTASVTVTPSRSSGDTDVTVSGALTFTASNWNSAQTVTVSAAQDSDANDDTAVIGLSVAGGDYASFAAGSVSIDVDDDETDSSGITLTVSPAEVAESANATDITVTATLNGGTRDAATPVTVAVGSGTATSGADFAIVSNFTITIPASTQSQTGTFSLDPTQDTIDEPEETVAVDGSTTVSGVSVTDTMVKITDDDVAPTVTLSLSRDTIRETDNSSTANVEEHKTTITASLNHASSAQTTVTVSVDPNSPARSSDYSLSTNKVLTFAAGSTSSTGAVTITAVNNEIDATDKTVSVEGTASNSQGISDPADVALTLEDDDTRGVTLSETDLDINEGGNGTYTVVLDTRPTASVTVTPSRSSGDTDVTVSGALTFTASNWNSAQTVTVSAAQDSDANDDTAVIGLSVAGGDYASFAAGSVSIDVDDDETDSSGITLTVSPAEVAESANATDITVTATLNGGTRDAATPVTVAVGSGTATSGADFAIVSNFTITIPASTQSQTGTFSLDPTQDTIDEPEETVAVDGSTTVSGVSVTDTMVKITDDDVAPTVTLSLSRDTIRETDNSSTANVEEHKTTITASLNHASSAQTTVTVSVDPNSPATSSDYSLSTNKVLTFAAGSTSSTGAVTITAVNNEIDATDKTVSVEGTAANSLGITDPADITLTLEDDDTRGVTLSETDLDINEGGNGTYTVVLDTRPTAPVTVTPSRSSGDTDVTVSGALTFTASNWNTARTVTVSAAQDNDSNDDTAVIGHSVAGGDYAAFAAGSVSIDVDDDETDSSGITLTVSPAEVAESANATDITVTATLNGATRDAATPVTVTVGSGTATSGADFATVSDFTITIPASTQSQTGTFSLDPTQDNIDETEEAVAVGGSTTVSGFSVTDTTVKITDDENSPALILALSNNPISENTGTTTVTATLSSASSVVTTVTVSVTPTSPADADDYVLSENKILTIAAETTASTGVVTISAVDNGDVEENKFVEVQGEISNELGISATSFPTLTIEDDDLESAGANGVPTGSDNAVELDEDTTYIFQASDFSFSDSDSEGPIASVKIVSLPADGFLRVDGSPATADQEISRQDIDAGKFSFMPESNDHASPYASFDFKVSDGTNESISANTMTLNVISVNDSATGKPEISGSLVRDEVLFAQTSQIDDIDGLTQVKFRYQWLRVVNGQGIAIEGATGSAYAAVEADIGNALRVRVRFIDDDGFAEEVISDASGAVGPAPPSEPVNLQATYGSGQVALTWEPPLDDGGSSIIDYEVRHSEANPVPDSVSWNSAGIDLAETISGLSSQARYSFEVRAINRVGDGPPAISIMAPMSTITPPGAPLLLTAIAGDGEVTLNWRPPASDGGAGITNYEYRHAPGDTVSSDTGWTSAGLDLSATVMELVNGQLYTFEVRALNTAGAGSAASAHATPEAAIQIPGAPRDLIALAGDGLATLSWQAPESDGGAAITDYEIRFAQGSSIPAASPWISAGPDLEETIIDLSNGRQYAFEVRAVNRAGAGPAVAASADLPIPASPPDAPTNLSATPGDQMAELTWEPPPNTGGAEISEYQYRYAQGNSVSDEIVWVSAGTSLTMTITGIANGQTYSFEVRALNEAGAGPAAATSFNLPVLATVPEAPANLTAAAGERQVMLDWEAPASDGGAPISDYEYRFAEGAAPPSGAAWRSAGADLTETVAGLREGHLYAFEVRAVNRIGPSPAASASAETPKVKKINGRVIEGWLARFGRTASGDTAEAIRQRLEEGPQRTQLIIGGRSVTNLFGPREESAAEPLALVRMPDNGDTAMDYLRYANAGGLSAIGSLDRSGAGSQSLNGFGSEPGAAGGYDIGFEIGVENGHITNAGIGNRRSLPKLRDLLLRSSFYYTLAEEEEFAETDGVSARTIWGGANRSRFDAETQFLRLDGEVNTGTAGFDFQGDRVLSGMAVSYSEGEGRFQDGQSAAGVIGSTLYGVYPYAHIQLDRRNSFWGAIGYGSGELQLIPDDGRDVAVANIGNAMAAFGGRGVLSIYNGGSGNFELALRSDALLTNTSSDAGVGLEETKAATRRLRLMIEATGLISTRSGTLSPTLEAGFRHDAGDAEQGTGFEIGGGLAWTTGPISLQLNGRGLLAHEDGAFREWGYSAGIQYQPGMDGRGLLLNLSSARGANHGGATRLWSMPDASGMMRERESSLGQSIQLELGYGLESAWRRALWYPFIGVETFADDVSALRLGLRISAGERIDAGIEVGRRKNGFESPLDIIQLRGTIRW